MSSVVANRPPAAARARTKCSALRTGCVTLILFATLALGPGPAGAQDISAPPTAGSRILIQTADGKFIDAKLVEARPDSILVRKGKRTIALPVGEVQGVWAWKHDPLGGLKAGATYGALVGVMSGLAVPTNCVSCDEARGSGEVVLTKTLVSAGVFGLIGLLSGQFDGAWGTHPGFAGTPTTPPGGPFPLWALSGSVGRTYNLDRSETHTSAAIGGYRNVDPSASFGFEFGILELPERHEATHVYTYRDQDPPFGTGDSTTIIRDDQYETAWTYATIFIARARGTKGVVRSQFLFGPAIYSRWQAYASESRNTSGVVIDSYEQGSSKASFGLMTGFGATIGEGAVRPALRARGHWIVAGAEHFAVTLEAGLDFH